MPAPGLKVNKTCPYRKDALNLVGEKTDLIIQSDRDEFTAG